MFEHGYLWALLILTLTLTKAMFQALVVLYPGFKSYKALESRNLHDAQAMLLYWCITAFINSGKEAIDQVMGTYSNFVLWKLTVLALKAAPLIIGPDRLYNLIVKPLYSQNEEAVDAVVVEAHKIRSIAEEAVPSAKSGDMAAVQEKGAEIAEIIRSDTHDIVAATVESIRESAIELSDSIQSKSAELGIVINKRGAIGVLEATMAQFEAIRDVIAQMLETQWEQHGPFITEKSRLATNKAAEMYSTHAPVLKQKASDLYTTKVLPRVQPHIDNVSEKYQQSIRPFVLAKVERVQGLWQLHGGPVRRVYQQAQPLYTDTVQPFVIHSLLPAILETLIELKNRLVDIASPPTEAIRTQRAHTKKTRKEANEAKADWKKRGMKNKNKWAASWKAVEGEQVAGEPTAESEATSSSSSSSAKSTPTLRNRKTKEAHSRSSSITEPSAPATEAELPSKEKSSSDVSASQPAAAKEKEPTVESLIHERLKTVTGGGSQPEDAKLASKEGEPGEKAPDEWANEPRSNRTAEPIQ